MTYKESLNDILSAVLKLRDAKNSNILKINQNRDLSEAGKQKQRDEQEKEFEKLLAELSGKYSDTLNGFLKFHIPETKTCDTNAKMYALQYITALAAGKGSASDEVLLSVLQPLKGDYIAMEQLHNVAASMNFDISANCPESWKMLTEHTKLKKAGQDLKEMGAGVFDPIADTLNVNIGIGLIRAQLDSVESAAKALKD